MAASPARITLLRRSQASILAVLLSLALLPARAAAWGDEGHKIVVLIAEQYLEPAARAEVGAMLAADRDNLTAHDIASEATWADWYRDSDFGRPYPNEVFTALIWGSERQKFGEPEKNNAGSARLRDWEDRVVLWKA